MSVDLSAAGIEARLRRASDLAGSLRPENRLEAKIDLSAKGVETRLRMASDLLEACRALRKASA